MTNEEIEVGTLYKHNSRANRNVTFLGIGVRKLWTTNEYISKHLVIIKTPDYKHIGLIVQEGENALEDYWDGFSEL